jgi:hypothetical protein
VRRWRATGSSATPNGKRRLAGDTARAGSLTPSFRSCRCGAAAAPRRVLARAGRPDQHRLGQAAAHRHAPGPAYRRGPHQSHHCRHGPGLARHPDRHRSPQASARHQQPHGHCLVHHWGRHLSHRCGGVLAATRSCPAIQVPLSAAPSAPAPRRQPQVQQAQSRPGATPANGGVGHKALLTQARCIWGCGRAVPMPKTHSAIRLHG